MQLIKIIKIIIIKALPPGALKAIFLLLDSFLALTSENSVIIIVKRLKIAPKFTICSVILGRYKATKDIGAKLSDVDLRDFLFCGFGKGHLKIFRKFSDVWEAKVWRT